jgi:Spy/CpxP family protein refolding chaperone
MHSHSFHGRDCGCAHHGSEPQGWHGRWQRHFYSDPDPSSGFGVRRPLRFLAWKLQLDEAQVGRLAAVLSELKTERAQAAVDDRRALTAFADALAGERFDEGKAHEARDARVKSADRLQSAVERALTGIHALLDPEQRERLAYLIRTGALTL